ncbi:MAG: hypothetical protein HY644_05930 [Acidobacteria bacterium]|nr:hypothetical protein [Acidobacteriota bacterium]
MVHCVAWTSLAAIVLAAHASSFGEDGWSGTITEQVEFGSTGNRSLTKELLKGKIGAGIGNEIVENSTSRDLNGDRKLEISVTDDQAVATVIGKGNWYVDTTNRRNGPLLACYEEASMYEMIDLLITASQERSQFSLAIDASGHYRISSSGSEKVYWDGFRGDRLVRMCERKPVDWKDTCKTAPPAWNQDCGAPETKPQYWKRSTAQFWTRTWNFEDAGTTCDPNHISGSRKSDWQPVNPSALPPWFTETMTKAGVLDRFGSNPADISFVMRSSVLWDLHRKGAKIDLCGPADTMGGTYLIKADYAHSGEHPSPIFLAENISDHLELTLKVILIAGGKSYTQLVAVNDGNTQYDDALNYQYEPCEGGTITRSPVGRSEVFRYAGKNDISVPRFSPGFIPGLPEGVVPREEPEATVRVKLEGTKTERGWTFASSEPACLRGASDVKEKSRPVTIELRFDPLKMKKVGESVTIDQRPKGPHDNGTYWLFQITRVKD